MPPDESAFIIASGNCVMGKSLSGLLSAAAGIREDIILSCSMLYALLQLTPLRTTRTTSGKMPAWENPKFPLLNGNSHAVGGVGERRGNFPPGNLTCHPSN